MRQYMKSKPARYGIKVWAAADVKTTYLYNLQVYTGKLPGSAPEKNQGHRVVCDMMKPLLGTGRGVTTDNFFTSVPTAEFLLQKIITMTGTLRKKSQIFLQLWKLRRDEMFYRQTSSFQINWQL